MYYIIEMDRQTAYTELLERYRLMVWRLCWVSANGNWSRCNDLVQEVSIALWLHFDTLRLDATPGEKRAWVYWQCRSTLDLQRRLQKPSMQSLTNLLEESVADEDTRRTQEEIEDLMAVLSPEEQRLVKLYLEGYRSNEIAKTMGLSRDSVYQRMHRVVVKARKTMLVLFLLLIASSIAVAVVPQWRHSVFSGGEPVVEDTLPVNVPSPASPAALTEEIETLPVSTEDSVSEAKEVQPPVEHLNLALEDFISFDDEPPYPTVRKLLPATIAITGTILTVSGLDGELVMLYDMEGRVFASKRCRGMCTFEIPSNKGFFHGCFQYNLHVGDTLWIKLRI